jgi:hypothetical protein
MYNCAMWLCVSDNKSVLTYRWFQKWLKNTPKLYTIKTKPIANHRVNIYTKKTFRDWFEKEYRPALEFTGVKHRKYIHNIDEKGCRIACPASKEVIVLVRIKKMYMRIPENCMFLTVIKSISANRKAISLVIIVPRKNIIVNWFAENITGHERITVSNSGYTNKRICMI